MPRPEAGWPADTRRAVAKLAVFLVVAAVGATLVRRMPTNGSAWRERMIPLGAWAPAAFALANAALVALGAPRLALAAIGGALFGGWQGGAIAWVSAAFGAYATFLFARWGAREWVRRRVRIPSRLGTLLGQPDLWAVVILRQLPIVAFVQNAALGLSEVRHRTFWAGTLIGTLPSAWIAALAGASLTQDTGRGALIYLSAAIVLLAVFGMLAGRLRRSSERERTNR